MTSEKECPLCVISQKRSEGIRIVFEDKEIIAFLYPTAALGHICVIPKKHVPIFMQCDEKITGRMFAVAQKLAQALNVAMGMDSSNILINTGIDQIFSHLSIHILPRKSGDGLELAWEPKQMSEDEMNTAEKKLAGQPAAKSEEKKAAKEISEEFYKRYIKKLP